MVHLYFGAFDVVMYLGGIYAALVFSKAICDQMDGADSVKSTVANSQVTGHRLAPMQAIAPSVPATAQRSTVSVGVSAR